MLRGNLRVATERLRFVKTWFQSPARPWLEVTGVWRHHKSEFRVQSLRCKLETRSIYSQRKPHRRSDVGVASYFNMYDIGVRCQLTDIKFLATNCVVLLYPQDEFCSKPYISKGIQEAAPASEKAHLLSEKEHEAQGHPQLHHVPAGRAGQQRSQPARSLRQECGSHNTGWVNVQCGGASCDSRPKPYVMHADAPTRASTAAGSGTSGGRSAGRPAAVN